MDKPNTPFSDEDIIRGCLQGNPEVRERFVRQFSNLVYKTIHAVIKTKNGSLCPEEIEDLHNTAFVKFFEADCRVLKQYEGKNGCSLATWVRVVSARGVLDHLRRGHDALSTPTGVLPLEDFPSLVDALPSCQDCLEENEKRNLIRNALGRLNDRDALFIKLHFFKERPLPEVASIMGVTVNNVYSLKHRALKNLKEKVLSMQEKWRNDVY